MGVKGHTCYHAGVMRTRYVLSTVVLLPFILSGCMVAGTNLSFPGVPSPTVSAPRGRLLDRPVQEAPTPAFAVQAGNCPEAASQAINLLLFTQRRGIDVDMRLQLSPLSLGCGASGAALATYRGQVVSASLAAYVLDATWASLSVASRTELLMALVGQLHALYPAAIVKAAVYQGDTVLGSGSLGMDNTPHVTCCTG